MMSARGAMSNAGSKGQEQPTLRRGGRYRVNREREKGIPRLGRTEKKAVHVIILLGFVSADKIVLSESVVQGDPTSPF